MSRLNLRSASKANIKEIIRQVSQDKCISEAAAHAAIYGFLESILQNLAAGNIVTIKEFGIFYAREKRVVTQFLPEDHPDYNRTTINPKFRPSATFRNKLQALTGHKISTFHQPADTYTYLRDYPQALQTTKPKKGE